MVALGANVVAVGQNEEKLSNLRENCSDLVGDACGCISTISVDLSNWSETEAKLGEACKKVDFLINSAGYAHNCPVDQVPEYEADKILDINLKGPINLIRMVARGMKERRFGAIVNVSSVAGIAALDDHVVYAASKAALDMVTKVSAKELGPFNVRVNSINPTVVWTQMGREHWSDAEKQATMTAKIPMGRFVEVAEVIEPIIFLLSADSSMITGVTLPIDGGFVAT